MRIVVLGLLGGTFAPAQWVDLRLPSAKHITLVVRDDKGNPVSEATIGHAGGELQKWKTDSNGRFEFSTRSPAFVVRKPGYKSFFAKVMEDANIEATLTPISQVLPTCSAKSHYAGLRSAGAFRFRRTPGISLGFQPEFDVDAESRTYDARRGAILHGAGFSWSHGEPLDDNVWKSVTFDEIVDSQEVVDSRGVWQDGKHWRELVHFGESASYAKVDAKTASVLDAFMDSACLKPFVPLSERPK